MIGAHRRLALMTAAFLTLAGGLAPLPAVAQDADGRLRKLEAEIRALQRKVFPGGSGRYFEAEIQPTAPQQTLGAPASGPVTDLLARMDAVERQLQRLTSQIEESGNRVRTLERRVVVLEGAGSSFASGSTPPDVGSSSAAIAPGVRNGTVGPVGMVGPAAGSNRLGSAQPVVKPMSDDPGEDDYLYGFRLWEAGRYGEAAQQLQETVKKHPKHARVSYARNLLGRAYLDDGKPGTAAQVFLENYQADRKGARAPDSLLYLATAMTRLKENQRACVALQELQVAYPQEVAGRLAADYQAARAAVKCN